MGIVKVGEQGDCSDKGGYDMMLSMTEGSELATVHVVVRWWDGYLEHFDAIEVRFGCDLLWMRLTSGENRNIPLRHVRWFSTTPESHASSEIV